MKRTAAFVLASAGLIAVLGVLLLLVFPGAESTRAIAWSAGVALLVQLAAFTILRQMRGNAVMIGWGLGSLLRLASLALYAFVAVRSLGFPAVPALVSLAAFLFATMFLEPFLLES